MRILLITTSYNGLCQRAHIELEDQGHEVSITLSLSEDEMRMAVLLFQPDLIVCPFLKEKIPDDIWQGHRCIIIHPGIRGDRGPSSLDWAIIDNLSEWGVTALEAAAEMDAGDIWASHQFPMREASKASIYRREVTQAAMKAIGETVRKLGLADIAPQPLNYSDPTVCGRLRPAMKQESRNIDWTRDDTATIVRKIRAADSAPGVLDTLCGEDFHLYDAHIEDQLRGAQPKDIIAQRDDAICVATLDGALWISHLRRKGRGPIKLPAALLLGAHLNQVPHVPVTLMPENSLRTFREIWYEEANDIGYLHFDFHNGAMSTAQCRRLLESYARVAARPVKVLVLMGGTDFWSNGIHLNMIEAATNPAEESWHNINAINDLVLAIINTPSKLTVSAMWGSAGAGGAIMPLAADQVWARAGCVLNPHYKTMGLYGSEYWTYLLPKRVGPGVALELTESTLALGTRKAMRIGLIDRILPDAHPGYAMTVRAAAEALATRADYAELLAQKARARAHDERIKPLRLYRDAELQKMHAQFHDIHGAYHMLRHRFVHKLKPIETGRVLAKHRRFDATNFNELRQALGIGLPDMLQPVAAVEVSLEHA
ncbi:MAG TPA: enoyl-CoA hydratase-related protein [Albitalea sp.]|jgi:putative two-component system hydrogenase maturation factor HypX/HoxX|nr:enoyl-CoA hydratase-related protein [Albitalea sp.]